MHLQLILTVGLIKINPTPPPISLSSIRTYLDYDGSSSADYSKKNFLNYFPSKTGR